MKNPSQKEIQFVGSVLKDIHSFPEAVQENVAHGLEGARLGGIPNNAAPMKGFNGSGVMKITKKYNHATYRVVYTIDFTPYIYVLHAFKKKSKTGSKTPQKDIKKIRSRYNKAQNDNKTT